MLSREGGFFLDFNSNGLWNAIFMSEPNSVFTIQCFREYVHAFNPNDYTVESSVQLPIEIYQKHYINTDQCTVVILETFLKPDWLQCDMI